MPYLEKSKMSQFEDSIAWQKSKTLSIEIYRIFSNSRDFGFRDQIQRASVSVMNNIAEGFERQSNKDFQRFLFFAKGSCGEVRSRLVLAQSLGYIDLKQYDELHQLTKETSQLLSKFIISLNVERSTLYEVRK